MIRKINKVHLLPFYIVMMISGLFFLSNTNSKVEKCRVLVTNTTTTASITRGLTTPTTTKGDDDDVVVLGEDFSFTDDSFALLHIQKTGGTAWEKHIFQHLEMKLNEDSEWKRLCEFDNIHQRYECQENQYKIPLFWDRYSSIYCDIHADYTELKNCIMHEYKNRINSPFIVPSMKGIVRLITFLRDPIQRYVSEYHHVSTKGATWPKAVRTCRDQKLYQQKCSSVSWESFLGCEYNLANNRQVRMLANYNILGCNVLKCWTDCDTKERDFYDQKLLQSAKHTLIALPFFGLTEFPEESQYLFVKTFDERKFRFNKTLNRAQSTIAENILEKQKKRIDDMSKIEQNNHLDVQLYKFAKQLFFNRIKHLKQQ